jgi:hypothetical protein
LGTATDQAGFGLVDVDLDDGDVVPLGELLALGNLGLDGVMTSCASLETRA